MGDRVVTVDREVMAVVCAAAVCAAAVAEGDRTRCWVMKRNMNTQLISSSRSSAQMRFAIFAFIFLSLLVYLCVHAAFSQSRIGQTRTFLTADEAAEALVAAAEKYDEVELREILGVDSYDLIHSGEPALDRDKLAEFASKAREMKKISYDPRNKNRANLSIGLDDWPFAIPIVKSRGKWFFDTAAGRQEILYRRVGQNELSAIEICRGYVEAQNNYALQKHDAAMVNQYAQRLISTPGMHDGLAWQNADGSWGGMVGERAAKELERSYTGQRVPFHGYYFKILKGQGPAAPLGKIDYVIKGSMIGGFALLAYPATYGFTGVKTFMVSQDGVVWEKDLGLGTTQAAEAIELFNPDKTWAPVPNEQ